MTLLKYEYQNQFLLNQLKKEFSFFGTRQIVDLRQRYLTRITSKGQKQIPDLDSDLTWIIPEGQNSFRSQKTN